MGHPIGERLTFYGSFGFTDVEAEMDPWDFEGVYPDPILNDLGEIVFDLSDHDYTHFLEREGFGLVWDFSNVDVIRRDLTLGLRAALGTGWGAETSWSYINYSDQDPILENETGEYSRLTFLLSRIF